MTFHIRYLDSDPYGRAGATVSVAFATREDAETIRRVCPNAEHMEIVEVER
jgi:hypothetical protein